MNSSSKSRQALSAILVLTLIFETSICSAGAHFSSPLHHRTAAEIQEQEEANAADREARLDRKRAKREEREARDATQKIIHGSSVLSGARTKPADCAKNGAAGELSIELPNAPKRNLFQRIFNPITATSQASVNDFEHDLVKRKDWGAAPAPWDRNPAAWKGRYMLGTPTDIVVHHTEGAQNETLKSLQQTGMNRKGLDKKDISYHMLIKKVNGKWTFFEGRDPSRLGSHAAGTNSGRLGIAVVDNLLTHKPEPELVAAIAKAVAYYKAKYPTIRTLHTHGEGPHCAIPGHTNCGHNLSGPLAIIGKQQKFDNMS